MLPLGFRIFSLFALAGLAGAGLAAAGDGGLSHGPATFTVDGRLDEGAADGMEVNLKCRPAAGGEPLPARSDWLTSEGTIVLEADIPVGEEWECVVSADSPPGLAVRYRGDGGSAAVIEKDGCLFSEVRAGHANFCQVQAQSQATSITVYKKWIGARDREPDVQIELICAGKPVHERQSINAGSPGGWSLDLPEPEGIVCSVLEAEREDYVADESDCQNLLVLPGSEEECTMVNTKVVKMIDMLNRYGLAIMILVFMAVGMLAARRFVP